LQSTFSTKWHINGKNICKNCWLKATTVTSYKLKHYFCDKYAKFSTKLISPRLCSIIVWLGTYFEDICNKMPTKNEYYLLYFIFWNDILQELNFFLCENDDKTSVILSYFSVVKIEYFNLMIVKQKENILKILKLQNIHDRKNVINISNEQMKEKILYKS
jgi:hypothetical protein